MNLKVILLGVLFVLQYSSFCRANETRERDRPNIVLIMADDMGFTNIGCYGGEIETPVLDQLAQKGVRFTQFYNTSRCCPTRAALLTGLYSHQAGIGLMTGDRGYDSYRGDLSKNCVTLAEVLSTAGYRNYLSGKWHVTKHISPDGDKSNWPLQRGFDRFYGTIIGAGSFYDPATLCRDNTFITPENDPAYQPELFYYSDAISDNAVQFDRDHAAAKSEQPFFLYVSYTSAHWPMHARDEEIKKYKGRYDEGFEAIREARHRKSIQEKVLKADWKISPPESNWEKHPDREWDTRNMEVYAAMVDRMDQGIGWLVDELKRQGEYENTVIIYLQDNGGCAEGLGRNSNAEKIKDANLSPMGEDELQTKIWPPMQTRDGRAVRTGPEVMAGAEDTFIGYGRAWANVSNTPFRGYKHDSLEGGISTPFIVHWPSGIDSGFTNTIRHDPCHLIDIMPTIVELSGAKYPSTYQGEAIQAMEGVSLKGALSGSLVVRDAPLGFEHHGNQALRDGDWKIVSTYRKNKPTQWELYNIRLDRTELNNLAEEHPDKLAELISKWQAWADRVGVVQWPFEPRRN